VKNLIIITLAVVIGLFPVSTWAQNAATQSSDASFLSDWFERSSRAESEQPHCAAPIFTVTRRLVQQFRYDMAGSRTRVSPTLTMAVARGSNWFPWTASGYV